MNKKWEHKSISEVCEINPNSIKDDKFDYKSIKYIPIAQLNEGYVDKYISHDINSAPSSAKRWVKEKDTIISLVRPNRKQHLFADDIPDNLVTTVGCIVLRPKDKKELIPEFLYYATTSPKFIQYLTKNATGSTYPKTNIHEVKRGKIPIPPIKKQKEISKLLRDIDKKIRCNRELSALFEKISRIIYKSWFEFYEPYNVKSNKHIPDEFNNMKIKDICNTIGGGTPDTNNTEYWEGDINWLTPTEVTKSNYPIVSETERTLSKKGLNNTSAKVLDKYSPLLTSRATVGEVVLNSVKMATNQGFIGIEPRKEYTRYFLFENIKNRKDEIQRLATGSTYDEISQTQFKNLNVNLPPKIKRKEFELISKNIYSKIECIIKENNNLKELQNYLLPLLLSGKIQINNS